MVESAGNVSVAGGADEIGWRTIGRGEPIVLLNGYAASAQDWDPTFLESLAGPRSSLICPDHRGIGGSSGPLDGLSVESMASDVLAVFDATAIDSAPLVGWSMGGFVAQQVAAIAPQRVESLVLLATDPGGPRTIRARPEVWRALTDHGGSPREQASRLCGLLFPEPTASAVDREFGDLIAEARARLSAETLTAQEAAMRAWHEEAQETVESRLAAIAAPVLCATGEEDVVIPPANAKLLVKLLEAAGTEARRASFSGAGHAFMAQRPEALAAMIRAFAGRLG